jgi:glycosyltransferase involved in cell wall biosynthesis
MRVLQVMLGEEHGGAETHCINVMEGLHRAGVEQRVVVRDHQARLNTLHEAGISVLGLSKSDFLTNRVSNILRKETENFKPDIVQTWMYQATRAMPSGDFVHVGWLRGYQNLKDYRRCDYLVGMTKGIITSVIEQKWPAERIYHIRPFADVRSATAIARSEFSTPEGAPLLLALGRLHWHKAYDTLLMALALVPNAYLWIAGDGEILGDLQKFATEINVIERVRFLGWQEDNAQLYAAADIVVLPSRYEPFGLVMTEAWAHKKPLIATKAAGPRATAQHEVDALLIAIDDVDGLATSINRILKDTDLRERLVQQGYTHYLQDYTLQSTISQYKQFYAEVLQKGQVANKSVSASLLDKVKDLLGK